MPHLCNFPDRCEDGLIALRKVFWDISSEAHVSRKELVRKENVAHGAFIMVGRRHAHQSRVNASVPVVCRDASAFPPRKNDLHAGVMGSEGMRDTCRQQAGVTLTRHLSAMKSPSRPRWTLNREGRKGAGQKGGKRREGEIPVI